MKMLFKRKKKNASSVCFLPELAVRYSPSEAAMMYEAIDFTLRECQHLMVKNNLDHGSMLTALERSALERLLVFLGKESIRYASFMLEHEGNEEP